MTTRVPFAPDGAGATTLKRPNTSTVGTEAAWTQKALLWKRMSGAEAEYDAGRSEQTSSILFCRFSADGSGAFVGLSVAVRVGAGLRS
ncbi:hypothetical protein ACN3XK_71215, partial [Actinomadura welshii]